VLNYLSTGTNLPFYFYNFTLLFDYKKLRARFLGFAKEVSFQKNRKKLNETFLNCDEESQRIPSSYPSIKKKLNPVALVRKRTIATEQLPHVGKISPNFCG
jgi:hypothetical protein